MSRRKLARIPESAYVLGCLLGLLLVGLAAHAEAAALRILGRTHLPAGRSVARDLRWASADSVYVARSLDGVFEVGLDGTLRRKLVPNAERVGVQGFNRLAVSPQALAVASAAWTLAWRPRASGLDRSFLLRHEDMTMTEDMDLQGDRYLLLGSPTNQPFAPNGAVAWIGTFDSSLKNLRPLLFDRGGAGAPNLFNCSDHGIGSVRFLADGSFVIAPGFVKGVYLFSADGKPLRSWTSREVGLDTDCSGISEREEKALHIDPDAWQSWLNRHHALDDILPLPEGPGLLVRTWGNDRRAHWELKVLTASGIKTYEVPVTGLRPTDRLRGDVRDGKIALLLSGSWYSGKHSRSDPDGEVLVLAAPSAGASLSLIKPLPKGESPPLSGEEDQVLFERDLQGSFPASKNASGCSRVDNTHAAQTGCAGSGSGCYDCYYSGGGGVTHCYENIDPFDNPYCGPDIQDWN
jgi:hypothetical protein